MPGFASDILPMFRDNDVEEMRFAFDLRDYGDVRANAEAIFTRLIHMREQEGLEFWIVCQVDTMAHRIRSFVSKAARAGVNRVFIGLESIHPESLKDARKGQNQIAEYRVMLQGDVPR